MDAALEDDREIRFSSVEAISLLRKLKYAGVKIISGHDPLSFAYHQNYFNNIKGDKI